MKLTTPQQHQLRVARDTLAMPNPMAAVMGGMSRETALAVIRDALIHAATDHDRRASSRPGFNPYALAQYLARIDSVCVAIERGLTPRSALLAAFNDRLLDRLLTGIGEPRFTRAERDAPSFYYVNR
jgi:hypothetical protein